MTTRDKPPTIGWVVSEIYVMTKRLVERMDEEDGLLKPGEKSIDELYNEPLRKPAEYVAEIARLTKALEDMTHDRDGMKRDRDASIRWANKLEQINGGHVEDKVTLSQSVRELREERKVLGQQVNDVTRQRDELQEEVAAVRKAGRSAVDERDQALGELSRTVPITNEPLLGLATTEQMFRELISRFKMEMFELDALAAVERALVLAEMLGNMTAEEREYRTVGHD